MDSIYVASFMFSHQKHQCFKMLSIAFVFLFNVPVTTHFNDSETFCPAHFSSQIKFCWPVCLANRSVLLSLLFRWQIHLFRMFLSQSGAIDKKGVESKIEKQEVEVSLPLAITVQ